MRLRHLIGYDRADSVQHIAGRLYPWLPASATRPGRKMPQLSPRRASCKAVYFTFQGTLPSLQEQAVKEMLAYDTGVFVAPPGIGKKVSDENAFPLRVRIPKGTAGLERDSDFLVDQVLAWDNSLLSPAEVQALQWAQVANR